MDLLQILIIIILVVLLIKQGKKSKNPSATEEPEERKSALPIEGAYQKSWLFTYNEKDAYKQLKPIADELGYTIFAKVRLLDLLQPVKGNPKYKTYFYKIQAKHIDFVLCDQKLVARYLIELDDSSHDTETRKERDAFVDQVVTSVGYKIIHTRAINDAFKEQLKQKELAVKS